MADEDERASDDAGDESSGSPSGKEGKGSGEDRELARAVKRRDEALAQKREAEARAEQLAAQVKELEGFKARYEELEGDKGKMAGVLARKDEHASKLSSRVKELETELGGLHRSYRHRDFVDRIAQETKVSPNVIKGLVHVLKAENPDFDDAPENPADKAHLKLTTKLLQELEPTVFTPPEKEKPRARPHPSPADHLRGLPAGEQPSSDTLDAIRERARNKNPRRGDARR